MKKIILVALALCAPLAIAEVEIQPPNMALGHWVTTADMSAVVERTLAAVPESSRAMMRKMMEEKMQSSSVTEECITQSALEDFDKQMEDVFGQDTGCEMNVTESTRDKFVAALNCSGMITNITMNFVNSKRNETTVVSNALGMGDTTITSVAEWKSSVCPEGL